MVAFVTLSAAPIASSSSRFVSGTNKSFLPHETARSSHAVTRRSPTIPSMTVLSGLDTVNQDSYSFSRLILGPFQPMVLNNNSSDEEREIAIRAAYRHVFGNAYIMEEEREEVAIEESQYKAGRISAKEFVRAIAKSNLYKTRFLEGCSTYRMIELNFMHLLGRAPDTREEMTEHHNRILDEGSDCDVDSFIDSAEYASVFGDDCIPFLRFRGAYTPCDSFNKQCALKGGWANSDKAMGGAASSGYNGSDGLNFCDRVDSYILGTPTPYETVAENTPLRSTSPNWIAYPDPSLPPTPIFVTANDVRGMIFRVDSLQKQYDSEISKKKLDQLAPFRVMVHDMSPMLDRGFAYSDPILANPEAKLVESPLDNSGGKAKRIALKMFSDTVSRLECDLEEAKSQLRVMQKSLSGSNPMAGSVVLPSTVTEIASIQIDSEPSSRLRISTKRAPLAVAAEVGAEPFRLGPISFKMPFGNKE